MPPSPVPSAGQGFSTGHPSFAGRVMFSASQDGYAAAVHELRRVFGRSLDVSRAGPDLGLLPAAGPSVHEVYDACFSQPIAYVRHLTALQQQVAYGAGAKEVAAAAVAAATAVDGPSLAVQAWSSGAPKIGYSAGELATNITKFLARQGISAERAGAEVVLSCCITEQGVLIGLNPLALSLSDWPGGRVRLGRPKEQVSRAEFKLEELFGLFPLDLPEHGRAIDLGAAPGGWTRILRLHGLDVWAIDPGDMAPALLADPQVHHERTTAGEFFRASDLLFDVAVNDMRMDPELSCTIMVDAADRLHPGAYAIVTLKLGLHRPVETLHTCLALLRERYDIVFARQLHHNRHELTVVGQRRAGERRPKERATQDRAKHAGDRPRGDRPRHDRPRHDRERGKGRRAPRS